MPLLTLKLSTPVADDEAAALARLLTGLTANLLGKKPELTAVTVETLPSGRWFIGGEATGDAPPPFGLSPSTLLRTGLSKPGMHRPSTSSGRTEQDAGGALPIHSFSLDIKITAGTNSDAEKARYIAAVFGAMADHLGRLDPASYVIIDEVPGSDWGYGGRTQAHRRLQRAERVEAQG